MNARPTYASLRPRPVEPFTPYTGHSKGQPGIFDIHQMIQPTAVAAIRKAFLLAKTSHRNWKTNQREGRFDVRQGMRAARREQDVFKQRRGQSTTHVRVAILLDASGSMWHSDAKLPNPLAPKRKVRVSRLMAAAVFGGTVAKALGTVPTIDLDVFHHSAGSGLNLKWRWAKGTPIAVFNEAADYSAPTSGNADGHALFAITERMRREMKRDERGIIMVVSDGLPSDTGIGSRRGPGQALIDACAHARKLGFEVLGVSIDGSDQSVYYGDKGTVTFDGDWSHLGSALARHIGAALAPR